MRYALFMLLFLAPFVVAETCEIDYCQNQITNGSYTFELKRPDTLLVNEEVTFSVNIADQQGPATGLSLQGAILDGGQEIYISNAQEISPGTYAFSWLPSFAGNYKVQYVVRFEETYWPTFPLRVEDARGQYAWMGSIVAAVLFVLLGIYLSLPRKKKKFNPKPLITWVVFALIALLLGYSVSYFYAQGGEKGFVVCGDDGCDLAIHWHSYPEMTLCGETYDLPLEKGPLDAQHTHKERNKIHFHALIKTDESGATLLEPEKLRLGELYDFLGMRFTNECFGKYCTGDVCPDGSVGTLRMTVNDVPNEEYADYSWRDGDQIAITFGP